MINCSSNMKAHNIAHGSLMGFRNRAETMIRFCGAVLTWTRRENTTVTTQVLLLLCLPLWVKLSLKAGM